MPVAPARNILLNVLYSKGLRPAGSARGEKN